MRIAAVGRARLTVVARERDAGDAAGIGGAALRAVAHVAIIAGEWSAGRAAALGDAALRAVARVAIVAGERRAGDTAGSRHAGFGAVAAIVVVAGGGGAGLAGPGRHVTGLHARARVVIVAIRVAVAAACESNVRAPRGVTAVERAGDAVVAIAVSDAAPGNREVRTSAAPGSALVGGARQAIVAATRARRRGLQLQAEPRAA